MVLRIAVAWRYEYDGLQTFSFAMVRCGNAVKAVAIPLKKGLIIAPRRCSRTAPIPPPSQKKKARTAAPTERTNMRISTRILAAASVAAMSLFAGAAMADGEKYVIGTDSTYPPFEYVDASGQFLGFDMDIARALCAEMKAECTIVSSDWDGIIPALQAKKFDMIISSMSITPERSKLVDFTNKYYNTPPAIAVPKDLDRHRRCRPEGQDDRRTDLHHPLQLC